jgi:hypothetical protein
MTSCVLHESGLVSTMKQPVGKSNLPRNESRDVCLALQAVHFCNSSQALTTPAWQSLRVMSSRVDVKAQNAVVVTPKPSIITAKTWAKVLTKEGAGRERRVRGKEGEEAMSGLVAGRLLNYST